MNYEFDTLGSTQSYIESMIFHLIIKMEKWHLCFTNTNSKVSYDICFQKVSSIYERIYNTAKEIGLLCDFNIDTVKEDNTIKHEVYDIYNKIMSFSLSLS